MWASAEPTADTQISRLLRGRFDSYLFTGYRGVRCFCCITVHNDAQLMYLRITFNLKARQPGSEYPQVTANDHPWTRLLERLISTAH
jgi:hypothetical protein